MKEYGILAYPAGHSLSPVMHNAAFKEMGIDAQYRVYEIPESEFGEFLETVKHQPISGLSVSLPYKETILSHLNKLDSAAKKIGACNTVHNDGGFLYGYNTDHVGAVASIEEKVGKLDGAKVCVLGAGGAARAIVYGLIERGAEVSIINRSEEKAHQLAEEFGANVGDFTQGGDILVQTTSIWINGENDATKLAPRDFVNGFDTVMDIVYKPLKTPLLAMAEDLEKQVITGEKMLLYQAAEQFKIWTGEEAPIEVMSEALMRSIS